MEKYNYRDAICEDIREYIKYHYDADELREEMNDRDRFEEHLNDDLWADDSVTGNASGSYFFSTWKAEEAICHNYDLLGDAISEFGCEPNDLSKGAEWADVTIRCYLLNQCIHEVLDEIDDEMDNEEEEVEE